MRKSIAKQHIAVSIHAPAKGATTTGSDGLNPQEVSIHAPAKGATTGCRSICTLKYGFNPRSREGSDIGIHTFANDLTAFQSTLPRRERPDIHRGDTSERCFNPRSREGSDNRLPFNMYAKVWFQSTLPRRERRCTNCKICTMHNSFNPRSREGSDTSFFWHSDMQHPVSIHAPAKGATDNPHAFTKSFVVSIHAPAKGAT